MYRKFTVLALLAFICLPTVVLAQSEDATVTQPTSFDARPRPFLEVDYGMTAPGFDGADFDFESIGMLEFKLGYTDLDSVQTSLVGMLDSYIFFGYANSDLGSSGSESDVGSKFNRFGGANRVGYGYQGKSMGLDLYNQNSLHWTQFEAADYDAADPEAQAIFDRYGSNYRFGHLMEAGLRARFTRSFGLTAGMEGSIVYPRYVFWPWLGSVAIYSATQGVVEYLADEIIDVSPGIGPVLYFLLKSGVSAGYYFLSQSDMNWPFDRETPVTLGSLKIGATFSF